MPAGFLRLETTLVRTEDTCTKREGKLKSSFSCVQHQDFPSLLQMFFLFRMLCVKMCDVDAFSSSNVSQYATEVVELNFAMLTRMHLEYPITFLTMQFEAV